MPGIWGQNLFVPRQSTCNTITTHSAITKKTDILKGTRIITQIKKTITVNEISSHFPPGTSQDNIKISFHSLTPNFLDKHCSSAAVTQLHYKFLVFYETHRSRKEKRASMHTHKHAHPTSHVPKCIEHREGEGPRE
jgi:hypothetical protein